MEWEPEDLASEVLLYSLALSSTISAVVTFIALVLTSLMSSRSIFQTTNQTFTSRNPTRTSNSTRSNCNSPVCMYVLLCPTHSQCTFKPVLALCFHSYFAFQTQLKQCLFWELSMDLPRQSHLLFPPYSHYA